MRVSSSTKHSIDVEGDWKDQPAENEAVMYGSVNGITDWISFLMETDVIFFNPLYLDYIPNTNKKYYKKNFKSFPPKTVISFIQD